MPPLYLRTAPFRVQKMGSTTDYPELGAVLSTAVKAGSATVVPMGTGRIEVEYKYLDLYDTSKAVYKQLSEMLVGLNKIIQA
jgi:hypothetical protein